MHVFRFIGCSKDSKTWSVTGEELHHLHKVIKLQVGDKIEITDGQGKWIKGTLKTICKQEALVTVDSKHEVMRRDLKIGCAIGALQPGQVDELIAPLTELGVDAIFVFGQEHVAKYKASPKSIERWRRILVAAVKQCKRAYVPYLYSYQNIGELLDNVGDSYGKKLLLNHQGEKTIIEVTNKMLTRQDSVIAVVGAEKGFADKETKAFVDAGFIPVRINDHVLRSKTAALASVSALVAWRHHLSSSNGVTS